MSQDVVISGYSNESSSRYINIKKITPMLRIVLQIYRLFPDLEASIVEITNGDILMVHRYSNTWFNNGTYKKYKPVVGSKGQVEHIPVVSLDGHSLFLGKSKSMSVLASNCPGLCSPNCIYYSYAKSASVGVIQRNGVESLSQRYGVEEFSLDDQSVRNYVKISMEASWIVPSINL